MFDLQKRLKDPDGGNSRLMDLIESKNDLFLKMALTFLEADKEDTLEVNRQNNEGDNALHLAIKTHQSRTEESSKELTAQIIKLLTKKIDLDTQNKKHQTVFDLANNNDELISILKESSILKERFKVIDYENLNFNIPSGTIRKPEARKFSEKDTKCVIQSN